MLIVNADDWGRSIAETDAALECFKAKRVTSVSAMVFMQDSERAAQLATTHDVDVGLHLNFGEQFSSPGTPAELRANQQRLVRFLMGNKYSQLLYNPFLRSSFAMSARAQLAEFDRLYTRAPSHIDGHHHHHLCGNMLLSSTLPSGVKMRRNFSFWPGEKSLLNRTYRAVVDWWLRRRYKLADYFFDLGQSVREQKLTRVAALARSANVELMTHPVLPDELHFLMGDQFRAFVSDLPLGGYARL